MNVVLCIDVEPDLRTFDPGHPPRFEGFERLLGKLPALRRRLESATGAPVAFSWFLRMDPQIEQACGSPGWLAEAHADVLEMLTEPGDELGLHTHVIRWDPAAGLWVNDYVSTSWGERVVTVGLDAFEQAFGRPCELHRGGDHFLSGAMLAQLAARGVRIDLTVEPGREPMRLTTGETARGRQPDYRRVPREPYRASPQSFPAPADAGKDCPLLVPLVSAPSRRPPFRRQALRPGTPTRAFGQRLAVELIRRRPQLLALAMRTHVARGATWERVTTNLGLLARQRNVRFLTASAAVEPLDLSP